MAAALALALAPARVLEQGWPVPDQDWQRQVLADACYGLREKREILQRELIHDLAATLG